MSEKSNKPRKVAKGINPNDLAKRSSKDPGKFDINNKAITVPEKPNNPGKENDEPSPDVLAKRSSNDPWIIYLNKKAISEDINRRELYPNRIFWFMVFCTLIVFTFILISSIKIKFDITFEYGLLKNLFTVLSLVGIAISPGVFLLAIAKALNHNKNIYRYEKNNTLNKYRFGEILLKFFTLSPLYILGSIYVLFLSFFYLVVIGFVDIEIELDRWVQGIMVGTFFVSLFAMMQAVVKGIFGNKENKENKWQQNSQKEKQEDQLASL